MLLKNPGFTLIAFCTMTLGIGANTAIFTVVNAVLLRPLPYPESERLMEAGRAFPGSDGVTELSEAKFLFLRDNFRSFEGLTAIQEWGSNLYLSDENQTEYIRGIIVSADFFRVLGVYPASGRSFTNDDESPAGGRAVILGDGFWRRHFGSETGIIGKTISLNDTAYTVVGIMPAGFEYHGAQDVLVPMGVNAANPNQGHNWNVIGRLKQDVTPSQARAEMKLVFEKFRASYPKQVLGTETFGVQSWRANLTGNVRQLLWILFGAVTLVLLIACANVANLQMTRASARQKEIAIRMAVGGGRRHLIRQLLSEGVVLALPGGAGGLLLATWGLSAMRVLLPADMIPRAGEISLDWRVMVFCLAASLLTGIVFGLAPAMQMLRLDFNSTLKAGGSRIGTSHAQGKLRSTLVVVEVALALALTVGAGLLLRTFANLRNVQPGFDARNLLSVEIAPKARSYNSTARTNDLYRHALEKLRSLPGVEDVAVTNKLPLDGKFNLPYQLAGQTDFTGSTEYRLISPDYFRVLKMTLRRGRSFDEDDSRGAEPVVIVNEAFARRNFPNAEPLNQRFCVGCEKLGTPAMLRVVGVVNDTQQRNLEEVPPATVFIPRAQAAEAWGGILRQSSLVVRTTGDPLRLEAAVRNELRQLDPAIPIRSLHSMDQLVSRSIAPQRFTMSLLALFAAIGLLLAAVGIYGVMTYSVTQRTHEIGVRMALGAQTRNVITLVVKQGMALVLFGLIFGLIASLALTRMMKSLLFGVNATDPITFAGVALLLMLAALLACYLPARRATKVDPLVALRYE
jgi:predicted permease